MRILHLDSGLAMRGGQWQALRLAEGLRQAGHSVLFLSPQGSPCFERAKELGLDAKPLSVSSLRRFSRQVDLTHTHDARSHTLAAILSAAPVIVSRRVSFPVRGGLSRWKYARPRHFIAVSNHVRHALMAGGVSPEKISVVYDGVPLLPTSKPSRRIVAPDSPDPRKGTALAKEAARVAGVPVHVSTNLELDLADAGLFVYITHSEGLGSAVLLAMSAGVPVVASNVGGLPEIVNNGQTGLLTGNTPPDIAAAILRIREDDNFARALAARARRQIEERFSIPSMVAATTQIYECVLGGSGC
jgi:glycosyltransferase involved in cell wall biosynthesis